MLVVATGAIAGRRAACQPAGQAQPEAAHFVTADVTNVFKQQFVESVNIIVLRGGHFIQYVRMAANRPVTEDHHATGQDIGPFHGDGNGRALVGTGEEVTFAQHDAFPAGDIHGVNN